MLMTLVPVPGYGPGVLEPIGNFGQWIDQMLLSGHMYGRTKVWDPEGLVSTLPAIANVLFGALFGTILRKDDLAPAEKTSWILVGGAILAFLGAILDHFMPINKQLWTPSFAVFTSGLAALSFGCFYWLIDVRGYQRGTKWLTIYGMNAIAVYALSGLFARLLNLSGFRPAVYAVFTGALPPYLASLGFALMNVGVLYLVAWTMHRRGWFLRF
jgi:predicted acyltransferase